MVHGGRVLDAGGQPVSGALVRFGGWLETRGDEPFRPFLAGLWESRGVRTAGDGEFELVGVGREVSAWHRQHGQDVAQAADEVVPRLPGLGGIRGVLEAPAGTEVTVVLGPGQESSRRSWAGEAGQDGLATLEFDQVEPGAHLLELQDGRQVVVQVEPRVVTDVELVGWRRFVFEVRGAGVESMPAWQGLLLPRGQVGSWVAVESPFGGLIEVDALPGRYLLVTQGFLAEVELGDGAAVADFEARQAVSRPIQGLESWALRPSSCSCAPGGGGDGAGGRGGGADGAAGEGRSGRRGEGVVAVLEAEDEELVVDGRGRQRAPRLGKKMGQERDCPGPKYRSAN